MYVKAGLLCESKHLEVSSVTKVSLALKAAKLVHIDLVLLHEALHAAVRENLAADRQQLADENRLGQVVIYTYVTAPFYGLLGVERRNHDDSDLW